MPIHNRFYVAQGKDPDPRLLMSLGPLLQVEISIPTALSRVLEKREVPIPPPIMGWALIDTGATRTCADAEALSKLGVSPIGVVKTGTAGGTVDQKLYPARLRFPTEGFEIEFRSVIGLFTLAF